MKAEIVYMLGVVAVGFAVNYALRSLPFLIFAGSGREVPKSVARFGEFLSPVIIFALIVYSFSGLRWQSWSPYLAGAVTVALQLWRRNPLLSIVVGTVLYMCVIGSGCTSTRVIGLDAARPSIRYSTRGFLVGDRYIDPRKIPGLLESYDVPHDRVIHILIDEEAERDLSRARMFMGMLAGAGYRRSVLVTKKRAESFSDAERKDAGAPPPPPGAAPRSVSPQPRRVMPPSAGKRQIRYKGAAE